jgi:hypothetical protein
MPKFIDLEEKELVEMEKTFLQTDSKFPSLYKNWLKSRRKSKDWKLGKWKFLKGIKRFHKSTKGKKFHRQLGRAVATKFFESLESTDEINKTEVLIGISSIKTHMLIEQLYEMPILEKLEYDFFVEYSYPILTSIEHKILNNIQLNESETELISNLLDLNLKLE